MQWIKCGQGHTFDKDKFPSCPYCAGREAKLPEHLLTGNGQDQIVTAIPSESQQGAFQNQFMRLTVGWLVCLEGNMRGTSFPLYEGENHIGRSSQMDVALLCEPTVSRSCHAVITYLPEKNKYILSAPEQSASLLCNGKPVSGEKLLHKRDILSLGNAALLFVPLCTDGFSWKQGK